MLLEESLIVYFLMSTYSLIIKLVNKLESMLSVNKKLSSHCLFGNIVERNVNCCLNFFVFIFFFVMFEYLFIKLVCQLESIIPV
jgi:hypothetical protein